MKIPNAKILMGLAAHMPAGIAAQVVNLRYAERRFMNFTYFTVPSFKKKQIVTTGHEDQPLVVMHQSRPVGTARRAVRRRCLPARSPRRGDPTFPGSVVTDPLSFVDFVSFCSKSLFLAGAVLFLGLATSVQAQFTYTTNNGAITITGYTGSGGAVTIPNVIEGLPVTDIGTNAFQNSVLTSVTIPDSVLSIGDEAFYDCFELTNVTFGDSVTNIGDYAFSGIQEEPGQEPGPGGPIPIVSGSSCPLTSVTIPNSVTSIGDGAFYGCIGLTNVVLDNNLINIGAYAFSGPVFISGFGPDSYVLTCPLTRITIPNTVTNIGPGAFYGCRLTSAYFLGNAADADTSVFAEFFGFGQGVIMTAYYLPGTTGWAEFTTNTGVPTALWTLPQPLILNGSSGVLNNQFGFTISWATNVPVVVEASEDLANPIWTPIATNTLTGGTYYFSDPQWTNYPARFYRLRAQ